MEIFKKQKISKTVIYSCCSKFEIILFARLTSEAASAIKLSMKLQAETVKMECEWWFDVKLRATQTSISYRY